MAKSTSIAKITRPRLPDVLPRTRLFHLLDQTRKKFPAIWISGPAGAGKTTLVSSYLDSRELPCLWYQVDERDAYAAPFFQYMTMAAGTASLLRDWPRRGCVRQSLIGRGGGGEPPGRRTLAAPA